MKLLVTGGLGFIGSNFILKILQNDTDISIVNVDAEFYGSNHKSLQQIISHSNYKFVKGNITNRKLIENKTDKHCVIKLLDVYLYTD